MDRHPFRAGFFLILTVLGVYIMRNIAISSDTIPSHIFRTLHSYVDGVSTWYSSAGKSICPGLNIDSPPTDTEVTAAQITQKALSSMRGGNPLKVTLQSGSTSNFMNDYGIGLIPWTGAWILLCLISYITCISLCCSWCCMHGCCKKSKSCSCCKQPQYLKKKWVFLVLTVTMLMGTLLTSIAGVYSSGKVSTGMQMTLCSLIGMFEDFLTNDKWLGMGGVVKSLDNVLTLYNSAVAGMGTTTNWITVLDTDLAAAKTNLQSMYTIHNGRSAQRGAGDKTGVKYVPDYVANLGPPDRPTTFTGMMLKEFQVKHDVLTNAQSIINPAVLSLQTQKVAITNGIKAGKDAANTVKDAANNFLNLFAGVGNTINDAFGIIGIALMAIFIAFSIVSVLTTLSIFILAKKKIQFLNKFLHFSWCLLIILNLITWALSAIFYPTSILLNESCGVIDSLLTDVPTRRNILNSVFSGTLVDIFDTCLNAKNATDPDVDFAVPFGLARYLKDFDYIFTQFSNVENIFTILPTGNPPPPSIILADQHRVIQEIIDGIMVDSAQIIADLEMLNTAVTQDSSSCTPIHDNWQLNSGNCNYGTTYAIAHADNYNLPSKTCIGFDTWQAGSHNVNNRYTTQFSSCPNIAGMSALAYVKQSVANFLINRNDRNLIFNSLKTALLTVMTDYSTFASHIVHVLDNFGQIQTGLKNIRDALVGPKNGLLTNLKCGFIKDDLVRVSHSMCTNFAVNLYQISIILVITSFFTLFSAITIFLLAKRILLPEETKRLRLRTLFRGQKPSSIKIR